MSRLWPWLRRASLLHMVLLGALLYLLLAPEAEPPAEIVVSAAELELRLASFERLQGRPLTPVERAAVREDQVRRQVLVQEALRQGLDRAPRIQRRLANKMIILLREDVPVPGDDELEAYMAADPARFGDPPPPLAQVRDGLQAEVRLLRMRADIARKTAELRASYRVVVEAAAP